MGKLFKIIVWIIVLTVIYIWFSTVLKSCNSNTGSSALEDVANVAEDFTEDIEESIPDIDGETFEAEGEYDDDSDNTIEEQELDYSSEDELADLESALQDDVEETPPPERYTRSTSSGQYMIIAGNYLVESNATEMNSKLRNLGYDNAEVAIFDQSQYHTVIASRYDSYSDAVVASSNLKAKGIDCYVKKKS
jgi:hypothetical protein